MFKNQYTAKKTFIQQNSKATVKKKKTFITYFSHKEAV